MKTVAVFLSLLFVGPDGSITPGNNVPGWNDLRQPNLQQCLERSKYLFKHPPPPPSPFVGMVSFCKVMYVNTYRRGY